MADVLRQDTLFVALTRPQLLAGVSYSWFVVNMVLALELFLIFRSWWIMPAAALVHLAGMILSVREPRLLDLWLNRVRNCPRVRNYGLWNCNSYRP
ncbi:MAG: type VI secretion protein [Pelagerythrobacter marensis]|nr:MAG: type VI secretion protein [Pelagerythrobacter marensis]PZU14327.1 MAG: type VI secretion protein [Citromicrobium sp.]